MSVTLSSGRCRSWKWMDHKIYLIIKYILYQESFRPEAVFELIHLLVGTLSLFSVGVRV